MKHKIGNIYFIVFYILNSFPLMQCQIWIYGKSNSLCYSDGKAYHCVPPFLNILENMLPDEEKDVSTCGSTKKQRICLDESSCHSCMQNTHHVRYLTDPHMNNNVTYWASGLVETGDSVTLTYSFNKLFEIYYISLIFIPLLEPDSVTIEKSMDNGKSWFYWHYFSKDCQRSFGIPATESMGYSINSKADSYSKTMEAKCSPLLSSVDFASNRNGASRNNIIAFTTSGSVSGFGEQSNRFIQWMSATNVRITMKKFKADEFHMGFTYPPILKQYFGRFDKKTNKFSNSNNQTMNDGEIKNGNRKVVLAPSILKVYEYFALADISMGGRCQCYGHAGRCVKSNDDNNNNNNNNKDVYKCDCQHNTAGRNCELCKEGFVDRMWLPATMDSANECRRCNCNLHSKTCKFDKTLYIMSNRQSGGSCDKCQHNTVGRHCNNCAKGYYRDWSKPLSHQFVCIKCSCHPVGSQMSDDCDQKSGQCVCKDGVTGLSCNRCKKGYQQTKSPVQPCIKSYDPHKIPMAQAPENTCQQCNNKRKRIRFKKYCRKDAVLLVTMQSREQHNDLFRFEMEVNYVWRINAAKFQKMQPDFLAAMNTLKKFSTNPNAMLNMQNPSLHLQQHKQKYPNLPTTFALWLREDDWKCGCPALHLGSSYLIILKLNNIKYLGRSELMLDRKSVALRWQKNWLRRLNKFSLRQTMGSCEKFSRRRYRRHQRKPPNVAINST